MPLPSARARRPEDCPAILNELLDYIAGGVENANLRSDAKVSTSKLNGVILPPVGTLTVGTTERAVPHGLKVVPRSVSITLVGGTGVIRSSRPPDKSHIYLTADAADCTCVVKVEA